MSALLQKLYSTKITVFFVLLVIYSISIFYISNHYLKLNDLYLQNAYGITDEDSLRDLVSKKSGIIQVSGAIAFTIVFFLVKYVVVGLCLLLGVKLLDYKKQISFSSAFKIAMISDIVFFIPAILKVLWFIFVKTDFTYTEYVQYYPLSILSVFGFQLTKHSLLLYPLQTLNLFEVAYWFLLAFGVRIFTSFDYDKSLRTITFGYIPGLVVWMLVLTFLTTITNV